MDKKVYMKPEAEVVELNMTCNLLAGSDPSAAPFDDENPIGSGSYLD